MFHVRISLNNKQRMIDSLELDKVVGTLEILTRRTRARAMFGWRAVRQVAASSGRSANVKMAVSIETDLPYHERMYWNGQHGHPQQFHLQSFNTTARLSHDVGNEQCCNPKPWFKNCHRIHRHRIPLNWLSAP